MTTDAPELGKRYYRLPADPPIRVGATYKVVSARLTALPWRAVGGEPGPISYGPAWIDTTTHEWTRSGRRLDGRLRVELVVDDPLPTYRRLVRAGLDAALAAAQSSIHEARIGQALDELAAGLTLYDGLAARPDNEVSDSFREWRVWWEEAMAQVRMAGYGMERSHRWLYDLAEAAGEYVQESGLPGPGAYEAFLRAQAPELPPHDPAHDRLHHVVALAWLDAWGREGVPS